MIRDASRDAGGRTATAARASAPASRVRRARGRTPAGDRPSLSL